MHFLGIFQFKKSRNSLAIIQERQLERQLADASLSSGWTRMMGAVEGVTGLHRSRAGNTITETQEGAEKRPWNSSQDKSKDCEKLTCTWLFRCFSQCAHEKNKKCSMIRSWTSEFAKNDDQTVCSLFFPWHHEHGWTRGLKETRCKEELPTHVISQAQSSSLSWVLVNHSTGKNKQIKNICSESIELTFETTNFKPRCFDLCGQAEAGIVHLWWFSLAVGLKDSCLRLPHRTVCWKTLSDTFSLLRSHEGGHLHPHRPRRSNVLVFHVWFSWLRDPSRLIQQQGCCERTRINIKSTSNVFCLGFASTLICHYYMWRYMEACPNLVWSVQHYITTGGGTLRQRQSDSSLFV